MKFYKAFLGLFLLSVIILPAGQSALAGETWVKIKSSNFELVGDANERELVRVASKMERFRAVFGKLFPETSFVSPIVTRVVVFKDLKTLQSFKPLRARANKSGEGFFQPDEEINYIALSIENETDETYRAIFHDYAHFLLETAIGRSTIPLWLNEGIAEFYAQIQTGQKATLGRPNSGHLTILQQSKLIPVDVFFHHDYYSLQKQTAETAALFQAQAWVLGHYLLSDPEKARQLRRFVDLLAEGRFHNKAFFQAFETDYAGLAAELKQYLANMKFAETEIETGQTSFSTEAFPVSESEALAMRGDLLYRADRAAEAEKILVEALKLDSSSTLANSTLAFLRVREKRFDEAKKLIETVLKADANNFFAHYMAAFVISREEMTGYGFVSGYTREQAEKMRESLRRAIDLNPDFAESYHLLALVNFVRNEQIEESLKMIEKALRAAPGNQWYQLRKAQLLTRQERFTEARGILLKIIPTAPDDRLKIYAENALTVMNSLEAQLLSMKNAKYRNPDDGLITDEPVSEEELRRRREKAVIESLNVALRIPGAGEKRILGTVTKIECRTEGIIVSVKTENLLLRLKTESFSNLTLTAFDTEQVAAQFGCGNEKMTGFSVVTYRPPLNENDKNTGEIVAIEFVPKYFKFVGQSK